MNRDLIIGILQQKEKGELTLVDTADFIMEEYNRDIKKLKDGFLIVNGLLTNLESTRNQINKVCEIKLNG